MILIQFSLLSLCVSHFLVFFFLQCFLGVYLTLSYLSITLEHQWHWPISVLTIWHTEVYKSWVSRWSLFSTPRVSTNSVRRGRCQWRFELFCVLKKKRVVCVSWHNPVAPPHTAVSPVGWYPVIHGRRPSESIGALFKRLSGGNKLIECTFYFTNSVLYKIWYPVIKNMIRGRPQ